MPLASADGIELMYDSFGEGPTIVLVMGIASQMILWDEAFCRALAARGLRVAQHLAIEAPRRVRSLLSIMSTLAPMRYVYSVRTAALRAFLAPRPKIPEEGVEFMVGLYRVLHGGATPFPEDRTRNRAREAIERSWHPTGFPRHLALVLAPTLVFALGCGPMTIWSSCFPLEYAVSTRLSLREGDRTTTQERVSTCKVVDQTDSIAANISTNTNGERHAIPTADGGVLFFANLRPCRWSRSDAVPDLDARRPIQPHRVDKPAPGTETLHDEEVWWIDDPVDPKRMEIWHSDALFDDVYRFSVTADLAVTEGEPTRTILTEVPWLQTQSDALARAREEAKANRGPHVFKPNPNPTIFDGFTAEVYRMENGVTCTTLPDETGMAKLVPDDECRYLPTCRYTRDRPCERLIGGLVPDVSADGSTVRFNPREPRPGWIGTLARRDQLPAGAPTQRYRWIPSVCVDARCDVTGDASSTRLALRTFELYLPAEGLLVKVAGLGRDVTPTSLILGDWPAAPLP